MTFRWTVPVVVLCGLACLGFVPSARAADVATHTIDPHEIDAGIDAARGKNVVWLAPAPKRVGKLLVFLPLGGANNLPTEFEEIGSEAGRLGYHTIVLAYKNEVPIANATACGNEVDPLPSAPPNCAINARMEILNGADTSPVIAVNRANSIENRLNKTLAYLVATYPGEGWARFVAANGEPDWSKTVIAGGSLGAGQAALIASLHSVARVSLFTGWTDAKHGWVAIGATPADRYFSMIHARDHFYERTCTAYAVFAIPQTCPLTNPADLVENRQPPFGTRQLVYNLERDLTAPDIADPYHPSTTRDPYLAKEADGVTPSHVLVNAWRSTLGDSDADSYLDEIDNCPLVANPDQTINPCKTTTTGTAGGSVPATLALTMGTVAAFGAFTPGVDRSYDASTTANVISTAGDAALAVSDPSATATGRLVNGAFALSEPLQARVAGAFGPLGVLLTYPGPISNDVVTVTFRQHIAATQALRTGAYSKTLTFTLSTITP